MEAKNTYQNPYEVIFNEISEIKEILKKLNANDSKSEAKELLTRKETAELLNVNLASIWRYTKSGKLNAHGISGRVFYKRSEVLEAVKSLK